MEEIAENNKLIAEFMGYKNIKIESKEAGCIIPSPPGWEKQFPRGVHLTFSYNEDWNKLIPVVEKIESLDLKEWGYKWESHDGEIEYNNGSICVEIERNRCWIYMNLQLDPFHTFNEQTRGIDFPTKLEATYQAVVEFIKWYNVQKETNSQNS